MISLTRAFKLAKQKLLTQKHQQANADIKIYDKASAIRGNPFSGDTTVPLRNIDNRRSLGKPEFITEEDALQSVLFRGKRYHVKKSEVSLHPDMVSDEIKDYYRAKIFAGAVRSAQNKRDKC